MDGRAGGSLDIYGLAMDGKAVGERTPYLTMGRVLILDSAWTSSTPSGGVKLN